MEYFCCFFYVLFLKKKNKMLCTFSPCSNPEESASLLEVMVHFIWLPVADFQERFKEPKKKKKEEEKVTESCFGARLWRQLD